MNRIITRRQVLKYFGIGASLISWLLNIKAETKHYLIVGAGIIVTSIAYTLTQAGQKVTLIDKDFSVLHAHSGRTKHTSSTKPDEIAEFVNNNSTVIIFTTYHSLSRIVDSGINIDNIYLEKITLNLY